jgi:hypothetical protein
MVEDRRRPWHRNDYNMTLPASKNRAVAATVTRGRRTPRIGYCGGHESNVHPMRGCFHSSARKPLQQTRKPNAQLRTPHLKWMKGIDHETRQETNGIDGCS